MGVGTRLADALSAQVWSKACVYFNLVLSYTYVRAQIILVALTILKYIILYGNSCEGTLFNIPSNDMKYHDH